MPTPINSSSPPNQSYDPGMSTDDSTGGSSSVGYEGGARGAGNAPPTRPAEKTDDRCFSEAVKASVSCGKLVRTFDLLSGASCAVDVARLASCVTDRAANPPK